ncbi:hypothetical protein JCM11251_002800 [Rhodosporidiobolus azoricus]
MSWLDDLEFLDEDFDVPPQPLEEHPLSGDLAYLEDFTVGTPSPPTGATTGSGPTSTSLLASTKPLPQSLVAFEDIHTVLDDSPPAPSGLGRPLVQSSTSWLDDVDIGLDSFTALGSNKRPRSPSPSPAGEWVDEGEETADWVEEEDLDFSFLNDQINLLDQERWGSQAGSFAPSNPSAPPELVQSDFLAGTSDRPPPDPLSDAVWRGFEDPAERRVNIAEAALQASTLEMFGIKEYNPLEYFEPPADGAPATRQHLALPDLQETANGDISVEGSDGLRTFAAAVERDVEKRLSHAYANSLPRDLVLLMLAPFDFEKTGQPATFRTRWMRAHAMLNSMQRGSLQTYGLAVVRYLAFCEDEHVPISRRFPAEPQTIYDWFNVIAHSYSAKYAKRHIHAILFWHRLHYIVPPTDQSILQQLFKGADTLAGPPKDPRRDATVHDIIAINEQLDIVAEEMPVETNMVIAVKAAVLLLFFGMCRLKDVTVKRQKDSKPRAETGGATKATERNKAADYFGSSQPPTKRKKTMQRQHLVAFDHKYDPSGSSFKFYQRTEKKAALVRYHLPWCKKRKEKGAYRYVAEQLTLGNQAEPVAAIARHVRVNKPAAWEPAFSFYGRTGQRVKLTRAYFIDLINVCLKKANRPPLQGHAFRSGGDNFYKLAGVDSEVIKASADWSGSKSHLLYQRHLEDTAATFTSNMPMPKEGYLEDGDGIYEPSSSSDGLDEDNEGEDDWYRACP